MSFTPGPWTVEQDEEFDWRYTIRGPYPEIPNATYALLKTLGNGNNNEGNARLAAAAPEMADKLKEIVNALDTINDFNSILFGGMGGPLRIHPKILDEAKALLRRIEGDTDHE